MKVQNVNLGENYYQYHNPEYSFPNHVISNLLPLFLPLAKIFLDITPNFQLENVDLFRVQLKDIVTIGIDTSGESLHKRGYRRLTSKAPITETLAAALIMLTPWKKDRIFVDPFCGSGTFPIEAAMIGANIVFEYQKD